MLVLNSLEAQSLFETLPHPIVVYDEAGIFRFANCRARRIVAGQRLVGQRVEDLFAMRNYVWTLRADPTVAYVMESVSASFATARVRVAYLRPIAAEPRREPQGSDAPTILCVEDNVGVLGMNQRVLAEAGYTVLSAASGETALTIAQRHPGVIDLLLTDVMLPGITGRDLAYQLVRDRRQIKVLYASGQSKATLVQKAVLAPGATFLAKPYGIEALLRAVKTALVRRPELVELRV